MAVKLPEIYPHVHLILEPSKNLVKPFAEDDPSGITVHYTASRSVEGTHKALMDNGLNYHLIVDRVGKVIQTAKLTHSVYHAGKADWQGLSPNRSHIAIALLSWGHVSKEGRTWAGSRLPKDQIVYRNGHWWDKATLAQEETLLVLCRWFMCMGIPASGICGHDECCIPRGRKVDPGGVTSYSMEKLRLLAPSVIA